VFRRKYCLYYLMNFLEGWRKQIFIAFAGFLLVSKYQMPLGNMLVMWAAVGTAQWFIAPLVGRLIDRVGERRVLTGYYAAMTVLFLGYIVIHDRRVLMGLFVADGIFFSLAMALTTYVRRLAPPEEHTPTLSMGVAMNHVAAVAMPLAGAFLWKYVGYQWPFAAGAAAAAASILVVRRLPKHQPAAK
ncbi:MAG: MFS transporter, partial [Planctomycetota bacterium]|nr:MFS transporter [Planctomycetota bacterium]